MKNEECDVAAEEAILLAIFQTPTQLRTMLEKGINVMSFGVMPYRAAWEAMMKLHLQDRAIDELRLRSELGNLWPRLKPLWDKAQTAQKLEWEDMLPSLHAYQVNRSVHHAFGKYTEWWKQDPMRVTQFLPTLGNMISGIGQDTIGLDPRPGIIYAGTTMTTDGISTGLPSLDRMLLGGFRPTEFYVWSTPTKHGKTSMAATLTAHQIGVGNNVVVFSLEMSPFYFLCRVLCAATEREWKEVVKKIPPVGEESEERWRISLEQVDKHLRIYPPSIQTPEQISERLKWHLGEFDMISLAIVDHMGIVKSDAGTRRIDNWAYTLEQQAYALKASAIKHELPLLTFSQLSDQQADELIKNGDLRQMKTRGSGGVAHACDFGLLMLKHPSEINKAIIRKKLDRIAGNAGDTDKAIIKHDPRYYLFYEEAN